jgi:hypothetical protein
MPADNGIGMKDNECAPPPGPAAEGASPQEAVGVPDAWSTFAHQELVTKGEVLEQQLSARGDESP